LAYRDFSQLHGFVFGLGQGPIRRKTAKAIGDTGEIRSQGTAAASKASARWQEIAYGLAGPTRDQSQDRLGRARSTVFNQVQERPGDIISGHLSQRETGLDARLPDASRIDI